MLISSFSMRVLCAVYRTLTPGAHPAAGDGAADVWLVTQVLVGDVVL